MRLAAIILCAIFALLVGAHTGYCQVVTVIENNDGLVFGDVFPGIPKTVSKYTAGAAAEYLVTGPAGAEITIDFTLPTYMNFGGNNMQLVFNETDCAMDSSLSPDQTNPGYDDIDPWHTITYRLGSGGLRVWLGGMVIPKLNQQAGSYTGTIVITIDTTGNW